MISPLQPQHVIVLNRWSVGWSVGQPPYEDVVDHDAFRVSYIVDAEGFKGLTDRIKTRGLVETVADIKDLEQLAAAFAALVAKGGKAFRLVALSEWDLLNAAALRERFGVAGMQPAAVIGVRDKVRMKEGIAAAGIKAPAFAPCPDLAALEAFIQAHGFPIVLKPRKMAASIGVVILRDQAQFDAERARLSFDDMECETYCPGAVFHIDGLMRSGELAYAVPFRYTRPPVEFVQGLPLGAMALPRGAARDQMIAFAGKVAAALSIDNTHFHLEVIMDETAAAPSPVFLEVGARVGGADIPRAVALITGVDAVKQQLRVELGLDLLPMKDDPAITAGYYLVPFPKGLPRLVTGHPEVGRTVLPTLVDEHRRMPGEILDGSGGYLKIPARFVFCGPAEAVARDLAAVQAKHSYEHTPVPRVGLLALVHKGLSFCHEIAACAKSLGIDLFVISSRHGPAAPLASLVSSLAFLYVGDEESLDESIVLEGLKRMEEAGCTPLACIATMESYRLLSAGINARLGGHDASVEALKLAMDKLAARTVLREAGLSAITAETLTEALLDNAKSSGLPYFIKPRRGAASFGAFPLTEAVSYRQIEALQEQMRADSFVNAVFYGEYSFILEGSIPGPEYCFEVIAVDGDLNIAVSHGKTLVHTQHSVLEDQMVSPGLTDAAELAEAHGYLVRVFAKLGLTQGLYHVELRRAPWGWELIEVNTRVGGGLINNSGKARLGGTSLLDLWIFGLLWNHPQFNVRERFAAAAEYFESAPGASTPAVYTFQQYFYGEPGKTIAAINTQASELEPLIQILGVKVGDRIPASDREHDLAMAMWALSAAEWQSQAESLKQEAPQFWQFIYEGTAPGPASTHIGDLIEKEGVSARPAAQGRTSTSKESARPQDKGTRSHLVPVREEPCLMSFSVIDASAPGLELGVSSEVPQSVGLPRPLCWDADVGPEARGRLRKQASNAPSPHEDFLRYSVSCRSLAACLPEQLLLSLTLFRTDPDAPAAMVVRGLPLDHELGPTPSNGGRSDKATFVTEAVVGTIAQLFGDLYSYATEKKGEIIQNIVPVMDREDKRSNEGSRADFLFHTENAYFDFRPDYLLLFGLRANDGGDAATTVAYAKSALSLLSDSVVETLRQPLYRIAAPDSFQDAHGRRLWSETIPIISGSARYPESRVNFNGVSALTPVAAAALEEFRDALDTVTMKFVLRPEELLIIDNRKAVHGRTAFSATFGPKARWLQRAYVRSTLWHGRERLVGRLNLFS